RCGWQCIPPLLDRGSPLRTGHLRDPLGPETHFASESFIDEIAHAAGVDPVAFRLKYVKDPRHVAVIKAAADRAGWSKRTYPSLRRGKGTVMIGRGFSYTERNGTIVAVVAEVEVNRSSGRVWARQLTVAHDCGLIINPRGLRLTIEGNVVQALSRTLFEEVQFDRDQVLSVDWASYPILEVQDAPERIDIVLLDHPTMPAPAAGAQATAAALNGRVTSAADGPLAGVLVSARKAGSTVTVTVVSDEQGRYRFPPSKLTPGKHALTIRAAGYELVAPVEVDVTAQPAASADLELRPARDLAAQLTNAEWMLSAAGTSQQKDSLLNCVGCHTLERIMRSTHDAAGFVQHVLPRMGKYANQSTPLHPQLRLADPPPEVRGAERQRFRREQAEFLAS